MLILAGNPGLESPKKGRSQPNQIDIDKEKIKSIVKDRIQGILEFPDMYNLLLKIIYRVKENKYGNGKIDWPALGTFQNEQLSRYLFGHLGDTTPFGYCFTEVEMRRLVSWIYPKAVN